jgi:hypothetical protein
MNHCNQRLNPDPVPSTEPIFSLVVNVSSDPNDDAAIHHDHKHIRPASGDGEDNGRFKNRHRAIAGTQQCHISVQPAPQSGAI